MNWAGPAVVYDPGTDAILALTVRERTPIEVGSYPSATDLRSTSVRPQVLLPWANSVDSDQWALLAPMAFAPGLESACLTDAALDPTSGQVLFLMETAGSRTLWSYSPGWRTLTQVGGQVPAGRSGDPSLILDTRARRLVLILWGSPIGIPGETWTFDLLAQKWTNQHAQPPDLPFEESTRPLEESRAEATFDPVSQQTFVLMNGELATYRAGADHWDRMPTGPDWPTTTQLPFTEEGGLAGPLARTGHSLIYDPVNKRLLVFGGAWQAANGEQQHGDAWAYDVPTNTWTQLVPPRQP